MEKSKLDQQGPHLFWDSQRYFLGDSEVSPQEGDLGLSDPSPGQGSNPRQKGPCESRGEFVFHWATDAPETFRLRLAKLLQCYGKCQLSSGKMANLGFHKMHLFTTERDGDI
ncbi:hypothetical protein PoB_001812600 [Plakobranchus ocellatus]|uniref:Uncharacterized protein n=1 Tax=Plakobranchus ocellatus TaxID=259542 RepID=A0AAV3Z6U1_9GAST|nr:hypothetical protein PoB_001812600 [Plakobranchus ocellatus]